MAVSICDRNWADTEVLAADSDEVAFSSYEALDIAEPNEPTPDPPVTTVLEMPADEAMAGELPLRSSSKSVAMLVEAACWPDALLYE